ncbi:MAG: hypothetical protein U1E43_05230 [Rhodospirillales bacterium]
MAMRSERAEPPTPPLPRANPLLLGHAPAEAQVARWTQEGRLGQALMICGPRGIGKATWAFRIARTLLRRRMPAEGQGRGRGSCCRRSLPATPVVPHPERWKRIPTTRRSAGWRRRRIPTC